MPAPSVTSVPILPRFRGAVALIVIGMMSIGSLALSQLAALLAEPFQWYYGTGEAPVMDTTSAPLSVTLLAAAVTAMVATFAFVFTERRRVRRELEHLEICSCVPHTQESTQLTRQERVESMMRRTLFASMTLMLLWLVQVSYQRYLNDLGWEALPYENWTSLLPLASIFGLSLIVGAVVAAISLFGLRTLVALQRVMITRFRRWARSRQLLGRPGSSHWTPVTELFGIHILSRPPPAGA